MNRDEYSFELFVRGLLNILSFGEEDQRYSVLLNQISNLHPILSSLSDSLVKNVSN